MEPPVRIDSETIRDEKVKVLKSILTPGENYNSKRVYDFFREHKAVLPDDAWPESMRINRDARTGLVSGVFDFRTCRQFQTQD